MGRLVTSTTPPSLVAYASMHELTTLVLTSSSLVTYASMHRLVHNVGRPLPSHGPRIRVMVNHRERQRVKQPEANEGMVRVGVVMKIL
ncbi:hypothetical protein BHE74_00046003 [Ensete ventricosum]|nr:hypothetical protein BHE74_00046003 [Ensete ventricosum]